MVMNTYSPENSDDNEITNPGQEDGDELFEKLKMWFTSAKDHSQAWRKESEEDYAFVAGDQWSEEDKSVLKEQLRPIISFNRVGAIIDSVAGLEVQNRQEVRFLPRQMGQAQINEVLTAAAKWFRDQSYAEDEESDAFMDMVTCGMAWVDTRLDYEQDPEGMSVDERIDPLEMYWDPVAKKRNLEDRRYQFRAKKMALEDAKAMFPDADESVLHAAWADNTPNADDPHNAQEAKFYKNDQSGKEAGDPLRKVLIIQAQWWDREAYYRVADPDSKKITSFPVDKYEALQAKADKAGTPLPKSVKSMKRVYKQAFIGTEVLESGPSPCPDHFTINCMTGKRDRNKNSFYGLVRVMKDPQRWANKFFSSLIHQFSTSGKGVVLPTDAVDNVRRFEEEWAKADGIKWLKPGYDASKIAQLQGAQMNAGVAQMMEYAIGSMRDVTGVNIEMMGQAEKDQPGILEYQRKQAGLTILAGFFDGLRRFRKVQGHILLYYIQHFFSDGRLIKIDGEDGAKYIPLIRDPNIDKYDVIVDDAPTSPNQKEHTWLLITQLMPMLKGMTDPTVWAELLKYSPLPSSLTEKLSQYAQQKASQPPQPSPADQAKIAQSQSAVARNIAGAIKDLSQAGVQGPGPEEDIKKQAVAALLDSGASSQDHAESLQQSTLEHQQEMQRMAMEHNQVMQQQSQANAHSMQQNQQQAALTPPPNAPQ